MCTYWQIRVITELFAIVGVITVGFTGFLCLDYWQRRLRFYLESKRRGA